MDIKFCKRCGAPVKSGEEYCEKCKAEMEGRPYVEPAVESGVNCTDNYNYNNVQNSHEGNGIKNKLHNQNGNTGIFSPDMSKESSTEKQDTNTINLKKGIQTQDTKEGIFSSDMNTDKRVESRSDYCYATFILGALSLFWNPFFLAGILSAVFFYLSRKEYGIKWLNSTEILLSRFGLGFCVVSFFLGLLVLVAVFFYMLAMLAMILVG